MHGHSTDVIFDLYNEPRRVGAGNETSIWKYWRNGGKYQGTKYIGMQTLASYLRRIGSRNLFWIRGPAHRRVAAIPAAIPADQGRAAGVRGKSSWHGEELATHRGVLEHPVRP